jgi:hypothetical protein
VPIPITVKLDAVKVIRRDTETQTEEEQKKEEKEADDAIAEFMARE